jgi:hypothetical protein
MPPYYFIDISGSTETRPVMYNEVIVESPKASPLAVDVLNGKADRSDTKTDGDRIVQTFIWDKPINVPDEPLAPYIMESVPLVVGSTFAGWADFRAWYKSAVEGFSKPGRTRQRLAAELTKGKKNTRRKNPRRIRLRCRFNSVRNTTSQGNRGSPIARKFRYHANKATVTTKPCSSLRCSKPLAFKRPKS